MSSVQNRPAWPYCDSESPESITGEKDACGVGFLANIVGLPSHWILKQALRGLECMEHRGGCGGDGDSGDGSGLLCAIPWNYLKEVWPTAKALSSIGKTGLGMLFLPKDESRREQAKEFCQEEASLSKG